MSETYFTLRISISRASEAYQVVVSREDPDSQAEVSPVRGNASFDLEALRGLELDHAGYGRELARQLFADEVIAAKLVEAETVAQAREGFLRVLLCIEPSAEELQSLRWELLRHPRRTEVALSTSETLLLSRFMFSQDSRPVRPKARGELVALVAVSAPEPGTLERLKLAPVDFDGERERIRRAFGETVKVRTLGGPGAPLTLDGLIDALRDGIDVLYLVAHGRFGTRTGAAAVVLQNETGEAVFVEAERLTARIGELQRGPRLVVLASCQSAGEGDPLGLESHTTVQATLASRLAQAGVPAVIGMQGSVSMRSVERMMPALFGELMRDGRIDRALAVARAKVSGERDWWMPALYSRLRDGRLWLPWGFQGDKAEETWQKLLGPIRRGKVVPIIGPRLLQAVYGDTHDTARRLAEANRFPLAKHEREDLPRVAEYISVNASRNDVIDAYREQLRADLIEQHRGWLPAAEIPPAKREPELTELLERVGTHLRANEDDPHRILAELRAPVYVTTTFDPLLERALEANGRKPQSLVSRWRYQQNAASSDEQRITKPSAEKPIVYYAFGAFGAHESGDDLVITEDDHFDYMIDTATNKLMPDVVGSPLLKNSLLFLGFRLTDLRFRVLFRLMMSLGGRELMRRNCHVAVQVDPDLQTMADVEGAKAYLVKYFGEEAHIDIYWGSSEDLLVTLRDELRGSGDLMAEGDSRANGGGR